jgi:hypothetical protein
VRYELPLLLLGVVGAVWAVWHRQPGGIALSVWFAGLLGAYSYAGERFPWLLVHPLVPLALLAALGASALRRTPRLGLVAAALSIGFLAWANVAAELTGHSNPREPVVFGPTSKAARGVRDEVIALHPRRVDVDTAADGGHPWGWWLRDLDVRFVDMGRPGYSPRADVLVMSEESRGRLVRELAGYTDRRFLSRSFWRPGGGPVVPTVQWLYVRRR